MLVLVEARLPFGAEQWQSIASAYNSHLPVGWPQRDGDSLKRKFLGLKNKRKPTGDPDCPEEVRKAKQVFRMIEAKCAVTTLHDDSDSGDTIEDVIGRTEPSSNDEEGNTEPLLDNEPLVDFQLTNTHEQHAERLDIAGNGTLEDTQLNKSTTPPPVQTPLRATPRSGLSPAELAQLSDRLSMPPSSSPVLLSQTARRRIRLDSVLDSLTTATAPENSDNSMVEFMVMLDQRQALREAELRREREEREAIREDRERQLRVQLAEQQAARDTQNQQLMLMVMAKLFGSAAVPTPEEST
ncbi:hypothetical protein DVH05_008782 [Phytophthora capsici]|nr:hypothetical protein DVH05_008782 [Phytophthora capsici]